MKSNIIVFAFLAFSVSTFAQTDEINISASFAQSIELRIVGNASVDFSFNTLNNYKKGIATDLTSTAFEVSSSTSFEVQADFTPLTNSTGDQLDMRNLIFNIIVPEDKYAERGVRWDIGTRDFPHHDGASNPASTPVGPIRFLGIFTGAGGPKTILVPGPAGNAGSFEDNSFYLQFAIGFHIHNGQLGIPILLDQNVPPGIYTCTMTLTAIPIIT
ncbi:MAG: hypothetical protein AAF824_12335 [Bacteroidota bacterium]